MLTYAKIAFLSLSLLSSTALAAPTKPADNVPPEFKAILCSVNQRVPLKQIQAQIPNGETYLMYISTDGHMHTFLLSPFPNKPGVVLISHIISPLKANGDQEPVGCLNDVGVVPQAFVDAVMKSNKNKGDSQGGDSGNTADPNL